MNNFLSQRWCLCLNVQNRIKLCRAKNHKFGDETSVCASVGQYRCVVKHAIIYKYINKVYLPMIITH